jgi:hypothetical protein
MRKIALALVTAAFAAASLGGPALAQKAAKKKDRPGLCGEYKYYDKKKKSCQDARNKK